MMALRYVIFTLSVKALCALCPRLDAKLLSSRGVSLEATSLFLRGRGKDVYILPYSDPTFALLLVGFTKYYDDTIRKRNVL
ncbi:hypothetical protein Hanom_Chr15g01378681 [Helianthus anomalus]